MISSTRVCVIFFLFLRFAKIPDEPVNRIGGPVTSLASKSESSSSGSSSESSSDTEDSEEERRNKQLKLLEKEVSTCLLPRNMRSDNKIYKFF